LDSESGDQDCNNQHNDNNNDDEEEEGSMSNDELYKTDPNSARINNSNSRPDVWITPLKSMDGSRKWKVKRVWDVEDVDDEEPEYEVDHSELMSSVRDLLGVPEDLGSTSREWEIEIDERNPWMTAAERDAPPTPPSKPCFFVKTVYDIDGELDGSDSTVSLTGQDFANTIQDITDTTDHENAVDEVKFDYTYHGGHKQRAFNRPDEWVSPQGSRGSGSNRRSWKPKKIIPVGDEPAAPSLEESTGKDDSAFVNGFDEDPSYVLPDEWIAPLQSSVGVVESNIKTQRDEKGIETVEIKDQDEQKKDVQKKEEEKEVAEKLTREKQPNDQKTKTQKPVKMWWH